LFSNIELHHLLVNHDAVLCCLQDYDMTDPDSWCVLQRCGQLGWVCQMKKQQHSSKKACRDTLSLSSLQHSKLIT
jgi:hypothetical protein